MVTRGVWCYNYWKYLIKYLGVARRYSSHTTRQRVGSECREIFNFSVTYGRARYLNSYPGRTGDEMWGTTSTSPVRQPGQIHPMYNIPPLTGPALSLLRSGLLVDVVAHHSLHSLRPTLMGYSHCFTGMFTFHSTSSSSSVLLCFLQYNPGTKYYIISWENTLNIHRTQINIHTIPVCPKK